MAWTNEQQQAITLRNSSLIVSAAAGSGKTSVLVERLIQILSDTTEKVFADRMIVVTFTNDAAAEMKQRLQTAFENALQKSRKIVGYGSSNYYCQRQKSAPSMHFVLT